MIYICRPGNDLSPDQLGTIFPPGPGAGTAAMDLIRNNHMITLAPVLVTCWSWRWQDHTNKKKQSIYVSVVIKQIICFLLFAWLPPKHKYLIFSWFPWSPRPHPWQVTGARVIIWIFLIASWRGDHVNHEKLSIYISAVITRIIKNIWFNWLPPKRKN